MNKKLEHMSEIKSLIRGIEGLLEILILSGLYYFIWRNGYDNAPFPAYLGYGKYVLTGIYGFLLLLLFFNFDGFMFGYLRRSEVIISQTLSLFITNFITYFQLSLIANKLVSVIPMLVLMAIELLVSLSCCVIFTAIYHRIYIPKNMVMIFGSEDAITLKFKMDTRNDKYHITRLISIDEGVERICREIVQFDAVVINDIPAEERNDILKFCYENELRVYVTPKISDIIVRGAKEITLFDTPLLLVKGQGLSLVQRFFKRAMDIFVSLLSMVVLLPAIILVGLAIKLEDGGPVFYKQRRVTLNGKTFDILKFRSMIVNAEKNGSSIPATDHDPRITRVGRFIRATRIDELPQFLNILKGDMSVVGPRPERVEHMEKYAEEVPEFAFRLKVKGGLTGLAQIFGKYNTSPYDKLRLDLMYIENYSLILDVKLILLTIRVMLKKESTEGFDKAEELERMKESVIRDMKCKKEQNAKEHSSVI